MAKSNVTRLPKAANEDKAEVLPPFDIGFAVNMDEQRQMTIRCPVSEPITLEEAHRRTDLLVSVAERVRSKFEVRFLTDKIEDKRAALAMWETRREEALAEHQKKQDERTAKVADLTVKREELKQRVALDWTASGRTGEPKLQGGDRNRDAALGRDIDALTAEIAKQDAEHDQTVGPALKNIEQITQEIAAMERLIKKHREIVG
jgi:hypothetical protein